MSEASSLAPGDIKEEVLKLRDMLDSNDSDDRETAVKRVVSLMRRGENVSFLFSSMLRCVKTQDVSIKRLVYLYLVTYSSQEPEQSIMAVNTFIADAADLNPIVRALAVRTMCRIKLDTVAEHMIVPLKQRLKDKDAYVRKTAAMAVSKLYDVIPETVENSEVLTDLLGLLTDENPMVLSNAAAALLEINERRSVPIFKLDERSVSTLLSAMTQCSEWVQTVLLDGLESYTPSSPDDAQFLIDRLVPFLKHANSAVVIGAFKCIYTYMEKDTRPPVDVLRVIVPPFITLVSRSEPEVQFVVLRTLSLFVMKYPKVLAREVCVFFCKYNDPSYVKLEKLNIIVTICDAMNAKLILDELEEYCNAVDVGFVRKAIQTVGQIALKIEGSARRCVSILVKMIESKAEYAIEESIVVMTDLLRRFPGVFESVICKMCANIEQIKEPRAKAAAIWILGHYSNLIDNVDVLLDPFLDTFHDEPPEVQHQILTAMVKVYVRDQDATRDQLQFVLNHATKESVLPDVRNRAMIYWRLLSTTDAELARKAVICDDVVVYGKSCRYEAEILDELIDNMGNVSGVLHILPSAFAKRVKYLPEDEDDDVDEGPESRNWLHVNVNDPVLDVFVDWSHMTLWIKIVNKSPTPLTGFAVALDKNWAGVCVDGSAANVNASLDFGESFDMSVPLIFNEGSLQQSDHNVLQVALRTSDGTKMFRTSIDTAAVIVPLTLDDARYKEEWNKYDGNVRLEFDGRLPSDAAFREKKMQVMSRDASSATVAFQLPTSFVLIAKVEQVGVKVVVVCHGQPQLLAFVKGSAEAMFTS